MTKTTLNLVLLIFALQFHLGNSQNTSETNLLFDFENDLNQSQLVLKNAIAKIARIGNNSYLKVNSNINGKVSNIILKESKDKPWNLNGYYQIKVDAKNTGDKYIQVELFVGNDPDELVRWYCSNYVDLNPGETKTITVNLAWTPWVFSPQLDIVGMRGTPGKIKTDIKAIDQLLFRSRYSNAESNFTLDNIRAVGKLKVKEPNNFFPFVDTFGQYKHKDWKGKIHSATELKEQGKINYNSLVNESGPKNRNIYGGWTAGPKLKATGFFRTEKYNDKWWMVDPEGYLFWTSGVNCVSPDGSRTGITGREHYFEDLPENKNLHKAFYSKRSGSSHGYYKNKKNYTMYNFYKQNLHTKYGKDWLSTFSDLTHMRFKSWGLNTIGFVSENSTIKQQKTPYVGSIWIRNTPKIEGSKGFWGKFHDVFDPKFKIAVKKSMASQKEGAGDPWCIGYFVDNEMAWGNLGSLAISTLKSPENQSAKIVFVNDLKAKYKNIKALNKVWATNHKSWEALLKSTTPPNEEKAYTDLANFYEKIAHTYFKTIKEELNQIAPNQNYLGCRFAWANNSVVLKEASKYMDIISFNKYEYSVENIGLPKGIDKPIMIGEFHFGALDRGSYHVGVKEAKSQEDRGYLYQKYIESALKNPLIVGAHWFQYVDEPLTGRFDGENYNIGLVDICDNPYEELIAKIKETNYTLYEYRNTSNSKKE